ncbi:hypothetical protein QBC41DRAFT_329505 [Cercophora samala]|uniref:Secreted protein n=1 Tax=Cercophora samala TaxID=330535 RepID=A0AA39Z2G7_9PEZI|nr:hypothetical protein QBC41DRAFT_329505 [Cercophora samala]
MRLVSLRWFSSLLVLLHELPVLRGMGVLDGGLAFVSILFGRAAVISWDHEGQDRNLEKETRKGGGETVSMIPVSYFISACFFLRGFSFFHYV